MRKRALLTLVATATAVGLALPSDAATPKSKTLYFANAAAPATGTCTPEYVLDVAAGGGPCSGTTLGYKGTGDLQSVTFSATKGVTGFKASTKSHLTGTVNLQTYTIVGISAVPVDTLPGPMDADITVSINGVEVGKVSGGGVATAPNTDVSIPIDLTLPASLNKKVVKSVEVTVKFTSGTGVVGVDYQPGPNASKLVFATA